MKDRGLVAYLATLAAIVPLVLAGAWMASQLKSAGQVSAVP
jgi:hypothetical protein